MTFAGLNEILTDGAMMKNSNFYTSLKNAFNGAIHFFSTERNGKIQLAISGVVLFFSFFFKITAIEWIIVLLCCALVIGAEMMNTAIENACDSFTDSYNPKIKLAKDIAVGTVWIISVIVVLAGLILFLPYYKRENQMS